MLTMSSGSLALVAAQRVQGGGAIWNEPCVPVSYRHLPNHGPFRVLC